MRNDPRKNCGGSTQAKLTVAGNAQHFRKLRAFGLSGGYRRRSDIYLRARLTHAMMLTIAAAASGQGRLPRSEERHCHGHAHNNGQ